MLRAVCTWVSSFASVLGVALVLWPTPNGLNSRQAAWLTALACLFALGLYLDIDKHLKKQPRKYKTPEQINDYMYRWITRGGRVVIFTRDMTWAQERRMENLLEDKARRGELSISLPKHTELTRRLETRGANVFTYEKIGHVPSSRFTIINDGRMDAAVAIGRQIDGVQVIEEFAEGQHPAFAIAEDLTEIIRKLSQ